MAVCDLIICMYPSPFISRKYFTHPKQTCMVCMCLCVKTIGPLCAARSASGQEQTFCLQRPLLCCCMREFVYGRKYLRATLAVNLSRKSSPPLLIIHSRVIDLCNMNADGVDWSSGGVRDTIGRARLSRLSIQPPQTPLVKYIREQSKTCIACFTLFNCLRGLRGRESNSLAPNIWNSNSTCKDFIWFKLA